MSAPTFPLTDFLIAMMRAPTAALAKADPAKLAAKYGISVAHAEGYLRMGVRR